MKVVATLRGTEGPRNYTLTFSRELSQVSLHHVDEHRRKSDDAYAGGRLRRARDPPPVSELGPWFRSMLCIAMAAIMQSTMPT
jgi:hypothetical protein